MTQEKCQPPVVVPSKSHLKGTRTCSSSDNKPECSGEAKPGDSTTLSRQKGGFIDEKACDSTTISRQKGGSREAKTGECRENRLKCGYEGKKTREGGGGDSTDSAETICDEEHSKTYVIGKFLGKVSFSYFSYIDTGPR